MVASDAKPLRFRDRETAASPVEPEREEETELRRIEEKAPPFRAGMNPTLPFAIHRSNARQDIPRPNTYFQVTISS
jgi:hypothetical protein